MNRELSYWEKKAEEQLSKPRIIGFPPARTGVIKNNRKRTKGRKIQVISAGKYPEKQIRSN